MELHLNYTPPHSPAEISHADKILMIGSCFAESIGEKLAESKFDCLINPNGILFNPASISAALHSYIDPEIIIPEPKMNEGLYYFFQYSGSYSSVKKDQLITRVKISKESAHSVLKESKFLIITFGTAFAYRHIESNFLVANCHKLPQKEFKKELLTTSDILPAYNHLIKELIEINPNLNIIFTVSPVKYLRDGIVENNLSKSILIQSVHELITANKNCFYFPAFELINDDLRDYRFYKEDMAHPNEQAINYIWGKFMETFFSDETQEICHKLKEIKQAVSHRPLEAESAKHIEFKKALLKKCEEMEITYPFLNLLKEKQCFI